MIVYDKLWQTMKQKNISQYKLIKYYNVNEAQLNRFRKNLIVKTSTLDRMCEILDCNIDEICEYIKNK